MQNENGLPIKSWYHYLYFNLNSRLGEDQSDQELFKLSSILEQLALKDDVREFIRNIVTISSENMNEDYNPNGY